MPAPVSVTLNATLPSSRSAPIDHRAVVRRELDRVAHEIAEHLNDSRAVRRDERQVRREASVERDAVLARFDVEHVHASAARAATALPAAARATAGRARCSRRRAGPRSVDSPSRRLLDRRRAARPRRSRRLGGFSRKHARAHRDGADRIAQVVRHDAQHFVARAIGLACDVVEARIRERGRRRRARTSRRACGARRRTRRCRCESASARPTSRRRSTVGSISNDRGAISRQNGMTSALRARLDPVVVDLVDELAPIAPHHVDDRRGRIVRQRMSLETGEPSLSAPRRRHARAG